MTMICPAKMDQLFHIFVGTKFIAPQRGRNDADAVRRYARESKTSFLIYQAKPAGDVRALKQPQERHHG